MKIYSFLRQYLSKSNAVMFMSLWYGIILTLIFIGLSQSGIDLRYANM